MTILDTSIVIDRAKSNELIHEDITVVTLIEYPRIAFYKYFYGRIIFPTHYDYLLAYRLQLELIKLGRPQTFSDLIIASIAINREEELVTRDKDFKQISKAAEKLGLKMNIVFLTS